MQKEIISKKHASSILMLFIIGSSLALGVNQSVGQDTWISLILGVFIAIPFLLIYARIITLSPDKNLFDLVIDLFGVFIGKILVLAITLYAIFLGSLVLRNFSEFIEITALQDTPQVPIMIAVMMIVFYLTKSGPQNLGKWSKVIFPVLFFSFAITFVLSITKMDLTNFMPVMNHSFKNITLASFDIFIFPFAEIVLFLTFSNTLEKGSNPKKIFIYALLGAGGILLFALYRNLLVLGVPIMDNSYFPSFTSTRVIGVPNTLERVENLIATNFILAGIAKTSVCLMAGSKGAAKLFNIENYNRIIMPVALLILALSPIVVDNTMDMFASLPHYKYYALPIEVAIPLLVWVTAEIKHYKNKKKALQQ